MNLPNISHQTHNSEHFEREIVFIAVDDAAHRDEGMRRSPTHEAIGGSIPSGLGSYRSERIELRHGGQMNQSQDGRYGLSNTDTF